ncbi:putative glycoside hydrolase family 23 protein [Venustampulla echinocandica]|uniref:Putative glycoside hydrolase family 23 protein n=1 Tax=Venustampulla echinocandica TaxID=2656787 RepID=A0A370TCT3_9HELO|nr:putative glycoside hydrolase family 23 protein [Venustampulla echinocandica]RDL32070.1 putative glycoside hydrolase family 23 protein [Venustampulla echinocandica]
MAPSFAQSFLLLATTAALSNATTLSGRQSVDPGIGVNPNAQGATAEVTPGSGPNGSEEWFNRGLTSGGWDPPFLDFDSLYHISRDQFYTGVGSACEKYDSYFQNASNIHNLNPVILAFIAMQESSCSASAGGPTPGLMQDNVNAGANYLRKRLDASNNNALLAFGSYNGWFTANNRLNGSKGLTEDYPCSTEGKKNGQPQNLDYLHQTLNGWFMGQDVYWNQRWIGTYGCSGQCDVNLC